MIARTREELLAEAALKHWMERLHRVPQNARLLPQPAPREREPGRAHQRADRRLQTPAGRSPGERFGRTR